MKLFFKAFSNCSTTFDKTSGTAFQKTSDDRPWIIFFLVKIIALIENNIFDRNNIRSHFVGKNQTYYDYFRNIILSHCQMFSNWPFKKKDSHNLPYIWFLW